MPSPAFYFFSSVTFPVFALYWGRNKAKILHLPQFFKFLGKVPGFKVGPSPISPFFGEGHNTSFFLYL